MKDYGYIEDGYTRSGFVKAQIHSFPELRFEYRPMLYKDRKKILRQFDQPDQPKIVAKEIAARLASWDLMKPTRDENGKIVGEEVVEITKDEIAKIHPELMDSLFYIIAGTLSSDTDPKWSEEEKEENEEDQQAQATDGTDPGINREEADAKNSLSG